MRVGGAGFGCGSCCCCVAACACACRERFAASGLLLRSAGCAADCEEGEEPSWPAVIRPAVKVGPGPVLDTGLKFELVGERTPALVWRLGFEEIVIEGSIGVEIFASYRFFMSASSSLASDALGTTRGEVDKTLAPEEESSTLLPIGGGLLETGTGTDPSTSVLPVAGGWETAAPPPIFAARVIAAVDVEEAAAVEMAMGVLLRFGGVGELWRFCALTSRSVMATLAGATGATLALAGCGAGCVGAGVLDIEMDTVALAATPKTGGVVGIGTTRVLGGGVLGAGVDAGASDVLELCLLSLVCRKSSCSRSRSVSSFARRVFARSTSS